MAEQPPPPSGQPPPSYQPPPPSNPNPLIPQGRQQANRFLAGVNPRIWVGVVIAVVVIAILLFWSSQQRGADTADQADRIALEQTSTQNAAIFITLTFSAITPTIDPQFAALQTQNALLAQGATDQVATNQAILNQPSQTPVIVIPPTQTPQIISATPLPTVVQPTQTIIAQQTQTPAAVVVIPTQTVQTITITNYRLSGASYDAYTAPGVIDRRYNAVWTSSGKLWQPSIPSASERQANNTAIKIMPGRYSFNGKQCALYLDTARNGQGSQNPLVASYGDDIAFTVITADGLEAWGLVECRGGADTGFQIQYVGE